MEVLIVFGRGTWPPQIILYFFSHFPFRVLHYPLILLFPQIPKPCIRFRFRLPVLVVSRCSKLNSLSRFGVIKSTFSACHRSSAFNARHRWSAFSARYRSSVFSEIIFVIAHRQSSSINARLLQGTNYLSWIVIIVFTNSQCSSFSDCHLIILCNATFPYIGLHRKLFALFILIAKASITLSIAPQQNVRLSKSFLLWYT